jgi:hypothetical protein
MRRTPHLPLRRGRTLEVLSGLALASWGLWLVLPFRSFPTTASWMALLTLAPEGVWGALVAAVGIAQVIALVCGSVRWGRRLTLAVAGGWLFAWACYAYGQPENTATVTYAWFTAATVIAYWRLGAQ